jgi:hypothetical protein
MKRIVRLTERDLTRLVRRVISEQTEVNDVERKQLSDKMIKDIVDKYYLDDVVNPTTKVPYQPFNNGGKLDYNKAYRDNMESIDQKLSELGFPNGVYIPENISRQEFDDLKVKWDQASSRLTESDLNRIVKESNGDELEELKNDIDDICEEYQDEVKQMVKRNGSLDLDEAKEILSDLKNNLEEFLDESSHDEMSDEDYFDLEEYAGDCVSNFISFLNEHTD